jgi:hypothetical protein
MITLLVWKLCLEKRSKQNSQRWLSLVIKEHTLARAVRFVQSNGGFIICIVIVLQILLFIGWSVLERLWIHSCGACWARREFQQLVACWRPTSGATVYLWHALEVTTHPEGPLWNGRVLIRVGSWRWQSEHFRKGGPRLKLSGWITRLGGKSNDTRIGIRNSSSRAWQVTSDVAKWIWW